MIDKILLDYMHEISKVPPISHEKMMRLFQQKDDPEVFMMLMERNLKLVFHTVKKYRSVKDEEFLDLVSEGVLGLKTAIERYDPSKGFKFSTYSFFWIRKYILIYLDNLKKETNHIELDSLYYTPEPFSQSPIITESFHYLTAQESLFIRLKYGFINEDKKSQKYLHYFYDENELIVKEDTILNKMKEKMDIILPKKNWPRFKRVTELNKNSQPPHIENRN